MQAFFRGNYITGIWQESACKSLRKHAFLLFALFKCYVHTAWRHATRQTISNSTSIIYWRLFAKCRISKTVFAARCHTGGSSCWVFCFLVNIFYAERWLETCITCMYGFMKTQGYSWPCTSIMFRRKCLGWYCRWYAHLHFPTTWKPPREYLSHFLRNSFTGSNEWLFSTHGFSMMDHLFILPTLFKIITAGPILIAGKAEED